MLLSALGFVMIRLSTEMSFKHMDYYRNKTNSSLPFMILTFNSTSADKIKKFLKATLISLYFT